MLPLPHDRGMQSAQRSHRAHMTGCQFCAQGHSCRTRFQTLVKTLYFKHRSLRPDTVSKFGRTEITHQTLALPVDRPIGPSVGRPIMAYVISRQNVRQIQYRRTIKKTNEEDGTIRHLSRHGRRETSPAVNSIG